MARARLVAVWPVHTGGVASVAALLLLLHPARCVRLWSQTHLRATVIHVLLVLLVRRPVAAAVYAIVMMVVMLLLLAARTILTSSIQGGELVLWRMNKIVKRSYQPDNTTLPEKTY